MLKKKLSILVVSMILILGIGVSTIPEAKAQFVIAWTYDSEVGNGFDFDEYGQGLFMYTASENVTSGDGSWTPLPSTFYFNATNSHEWEVGYGIMIRFYAFMNSTLTGASDLADGDNYQRMNVTVTAWGQEVYNETSISIFYRSSYFDAEMWLYGFETILNIIPVAGLTYIVTITYEVYW